MKVLKKQKIKFNLSHAVNKVERNGDTVTVTAKSPEAVVGVRSLLHP